MLAKPLNSILPRKGQTVQVYVSRQDMGYGIRPFIVIGVSSRYVTLFSVTNLKAFKIKRLDWPTFHVVEFSPNLGDILRQISASWEIVKAHGGRTNRAHIERALEVLEPLIGVKVA